MDSYQSIEAEKRIGDEKIEASYSKFINQSGQKERFSKTKSNRTQRKRDFTKGTSMDKGEWDVLNIQNDKDETSKAESKSAYKSYTPKSVFEDFDYIDIKKMGGAAGKKSSKKTSSKKTSSKKKSSKKKSSKKKSSKKGGKVSKSTSSRKTPSRKKSSSKKKLGGSCSKC